MSSLLHISSVEEQLELPRLTGTLRAFSDVSKKYMSLDAATERALMRRRRELDQSLTTAAEPARKKADWQAVCMKLVPDRTDAKLAKLRALLDRLRTGVAKQLLNEDFNDARLLDEAALFILELFYEHCSSTAVYSGSASNFQGLDKASKRLKERFGQFQRNLFDSCKELMESLFTELHTLGLTQLLDELFDRHRVLEAHRLHREQRAAAGD